jgi:hypothetical protein
MVQGRDRAGEAKICYQLPYMRQSKTAIVHTPSVFGIMFETSSPDHFSTGLNEA